MQFGGGNMGGVALVAGNDATKDFRNVPKGPVEYFLIAISFALLSTSTAFALVIDTEGSAAAEGVDDLDLILNSVFARLTMLWDPTHMAFALAPAQLRTILGLFNQRDFLGTLDNGDQVPASGGSATTFTIQLKIPVALVDYFNDGNIFGNGSARLSTGSLILTGGASLTPNVVLANGTAAVSGLAVSMTSFAGAGSEFDVGMTWNVSRPANLPTNYEMAPGTRLAVLHTSPVDSSTVTNWDVEGYARLLPPSSLGARYQGNRLRAGGFDITKRCTPLVYIERERQFGDWLAHKDKAINLNAVSGVSSLTIYDIIAVPKPPSIVEAVSREAGKGGPITIVHPTPRTLQPGTPIAPALQDLLPARILPGAVGGSAAQATPNPAAAAATVQAKDVKAKQFSSIFNLFSRGN